MRIFCPAMAGSPSCSLKKRSCELGVLVGAPTPEVGRVGRPGNLRSLPQAHGETKSVAAQVLSFNVTTRSGARSRGPRIGELLDDLDDLAGPDGAATLA